MVTEFYDMNLDSEKKKAINLYARIQTIWMSTQVHIVPHDPGWPQLFAAESGRIEAALAPNVVAIHHIGSTAIPGIYAKPVIDMLVEVGNVADVDTRSLAMESLGYEVMGEFGIPGRRYFRKDDPGGVRTHQIHIFESASAQIERHIAFRDYMIAHPDDARAYSDLKRSLALKHPDSADDYMDGKDEFIKEIDRRASVWRLSSRG